MWECGNVEMWGFGDVGMWKLNLLRKAPLQIEALKGLNFNNRGWNPRKKKNRKKSPERVEFQYTKIFNPFRAELMQRFMSTSFTIRHCSWQNLLLLRFHHFSVTKLLIGVESPLTGAFQQLNEKLTCWYYQLLYFWKLRLLDLQQGIFYKFIR